MSIGGRVGAGRCPNPIRMDPVCGQSARTCPVATLPMRLLADPTAAAAFRSSWNASDNRYVAVPSGRVAPSPAQAASIHRASILVVGDGGQVPMSTSASSSHNCAQAADDSRSRRAADARLATSIVACGSDTARIASRGDGLHGSRGMVVTLEHQPEVEGPNVGRQPRTSSRVAHRMTAADEAVRQIGTMPATAGLLQSALLLREYAWSSRTNAT